MAQMIDGATGVILAGGRSRRFGSNKALAAWRGKTLIEGVAENLAGVFPERLVVAKELGAFAFLKRPGLELAQDLLPETHSLGGVYSALCHSKTELAFICGCDMPFVQSKLVAALWDALHGYDAAVPVWGGEIQSLCGFYSKRSLGVLECMLEDRRLRVRDLFTTIRTRFLLEEEIRSVDPRGLSFVDLDTREAYEWALGKPPC